MKLNNWALVAIVSVAAIGQQNNSDAADDLVIAVAGPITGQYAVFGEQMLLTK